MTAHIYVTCDTAQCTRSADIRGVEPQWMGPLINKGWGVAYITGHLKLTCPECKRGLDPRNSELRDAAQSLKRFLMDFNDDGRMLSPCTIRGGEHTDCVYHIHIEDDDYPYVMVEQFGYSLRLTMILPDGMKIQYDDTFWE